jgi:heme-degrading monooxygenase HmoA
VHVAQLNVARLLAPIESPTLSGFVRRLDEVNAVADAAPGFVWRLQSESGNATDIRPWGDDVIVNMSVWESVDALRDYVYGPEHAAVLRRRREWFSVLGAPHLVLWWVPVGHRPDLAEARQRLDLLERDGPSAAAFTLRQPFPEPA